MRRSVLLLIVLAGCGPSGPPRPAVHPVRGEVYVNGKPAAGAVVELRAADDAERDQFRPHGICGPDGSFRLTTFRSNDGAPVGDYALTVTWPLPPRPGTDEDGPDRFTGRHADPRRPPQRVAVTAGTNDLGRIDLK